MADAGLSSDRRGIFEPAGKSKARSGRVHSRVTGSKVNLLCPQIMFTVEKTMFWKVKGAKQR